MPERAPPSVSFSIMSYLKKSSFTEQHKKRMSQNGIAAPLFPSVVIIRIKRLVKIIIR